MKQCRSCGQENADAAQFCMECGTPLADAPPVFNLNNQSAPNSFSGETPTTNFGANRPMPNFGGNQPNFMPNYAAAAPAPKSKSKLGLILGGVAAVFVLLGIAGAALMAYDVLTADNTTPVANATPFPIASPTGGGDNSLYPKPSVALKSSPDTNDPANPQPSFTPPLEATKKGVFTVNANEGWQLSDIDTVASERYSTSVQGAVDLAGIKATAYSSGVSDAKTKSRRIFEQFPTGALLMRTRYADGNTSNTLAMTTNGANGTWQNFPNEIGKLEFRVNDNAPENNSGQFVVTVRMTSVPKAKK